MKISYIEQQDKEVMPYFKKEKGYTNKYMMPRINKIIVNCGIGKLVTSDNYSKDDIVNTISESIALITGQKPKVCKAKKSIAGFKLREGMPVGLAVTLRGKTMINFYDKLVNVVIPRTRDFWGFNRKNFDTNGNLSIGIKELSAFLEIDTDRIKIPFSLQICFNVKGKDKEDSVKMFELLKFPLSKVK